MFLEVSEYNRKTCWVLKCDIRKFFASIDHGVLKNVLAKYIPDQDIMWLLGNIINSFNSRNAESRIGVRDKFNSASQSRCPESSSGLRERGLPLGNLTSQLLVNIYMNEFDQYMKHELKIKSYIRYADDFVILSDDRQKLIKLILLIQSFLKGQLGLFLHPNKLFLKSFGSGIDFLGWVHFPNHKVLRTATKKHMLRRIRNHPTLETMQSYLGLLDHGNTFKIQHQIKGDYWLLKN